MIHRLFDPLMAESAGRGAALDWKTSLQELTAALGLGVPDYLIDEAGPDHAKTFTAWVVVAGSGTAASEGRSKKEAEQRAAEAACAGADRPGRRPPRPDASGGADGAASAGPASDGTRPDARAARGRDRPAGPGQAGSPAARIAAVEVRHPRAVRRHVAGGGRLRRRAGRPDRSLDVRRRGKYLWLPLDTGDAVVGHLGMSGQLLLPADGAPDGPHLRVRFTFDRRRARSCASSTSARSAAWRSPRAAPTLPAEIAHIARDPMDPAFDDDGVRRGAAPPAHRGQAGAARPDADLRGGQHLRRRGAVAGPAARRPADRRR